MKGDRRIREKVSERGGIERKEVDQEQNPVEHR